MRLFVSFRAVGSFVSQVLLLMNLYIPVSFYWFHVVKNRKNRGIIVPLTRRQRAGGRGRSFSTRKNETQHLRAVNRERIKHTTLLKRIVNKQKQITNKNNFSIL